MNHIAKGTPLFQLIPAKEFRELCDRYQINKGVRKLTTQKQVWALVMAFLFKLESLREIELTLGIPHSTLSDANANRESQFFEELCRLVLWKIYARLRGRKIKQAVRTILALDSTKCWVHGSLSKLEKWKTKSCSKINGKASTKLHVIWNPVNHRRSRSTPTSTASAANKILRNPLGISQNNKNSMDTVSYETDISFFRRF